MIRFTTRARRAARIVSDAVRSVVAPAALVLAAEADRVPNPADVFTPDEMPAPEAIEAAAAGYTAAGDQARAADRAKRRTRKVLDRLPAGIYGRFTVERVESSRQTPDLDSIRDTFARLGLGEVPMRTCAPSLRITAAAADVVTFPAAADTAPVPIAA